METQSVTAPYLLKGAVYALEQCGLLLLDASLLYRNGSFATAVVLATFAREELGRWQILLKLRREVLGGEQLSLGEVRARCKTHDVNQMGFEDRDIAVEYHWAEGDYDLLPWFAAMIVNHKVAAIVSGGGPAALAAKSATPSIPIIFSSRADPIQLGLITALKQPGTNITGVVSMSEGFVARQIKLIHEVAPNATLIAVLVNSSNPNNPQEIGEAREAQTMLGIKTTVPQATTRRDIDAAFAKSVELKVGALVIGADPYFDSQLDKFAALATRFNIPTIHALRGFVASGGLMSYGADLANAYRLAGIYTGRILKGEKPADLPVQQSAKGELAVNLQTAKALGLTVPQSVLAAADEVIE